MKRVAAAVKKRIRSLKQKLVLFMELRVEVLVLCYCCVQSYNHHVIYDSMSLYLYHFSTSICCFSFLLIIFHFFFAFVYRLIVLCLHFKWFKSSFKLTVYKLQSICSRLTELNSFDCITLSADYNNARFFLLLSFHILLQIIHLIYNMCEKCPFNRNAMSRSVCWHTNRVV